MIFKSATRQTKTRLGVECKGLNVTVRINAKEIPMDNAEHCLIQAQECRRLLALAQSEAVASVLKNLSRSWVMIANQIDRYAAIMREEAAQRKVASIAGIAKDQLRRAI